MIQKEKKFLHETAYNTATHTSAFLNVFFGALGRTSKVPLYLRESRQVYSSSCMVKKVRYDVNILMVPGTHWISPQLTSLHTDSYTVDHTAGILTRGAARDPSKLGRGAVEYV